LILPATLLAAPAILRSRNWETNSITATAAAASALAKAGLHEPERRAFRPHATVARLRAGARAPRVTPREGPEPVAFAGESVTLYRSRLSAAGARYEPLERVTIIG